MKYEILMAKLLLIYLVTFLGLGVSAQQTFVLESNPSLKVLGTSSLHDWEMVSNKASGQATMIIENGRLTGIKEAKFIMDAETLKSGKSQMDNNAYKAINTKKNPSISFEYLEMEPKGSMSKIKGNLKIGEVSKLVILDMKNRLEGEKIMFNGVTSFKLTDFNIDPPTALLGTIRTGDEVSLDINMVLRLKN